MADHDESSERGRPLRGIPAFSPAPADFTPAAGNADRSARPRRTRSGSGGIAVTVPALVVLYHCDLRRIGQRALLPNLFNNIPCAVSRIEPLFSGYDGGRATPLDDPHVSRQPMLLIGENNGDVRIEADPRLQHQVLGQAGCGNALLSRADVERGVVIVLGNSVMLLLKHVEIHAKRQAPHGMIGHGDVVERVRSEIQRMARVDVPVLIRGETGSGKERVARAIHAASARADKPFVAVNMAAIAPSAATSELFGHRRGAFTDAVGNHPGFFGSANSGTLFLDEIGEAPSAVQTLLLRALDEGEIQPVGGLPRKVDVRLIAATDTDLDHDVAIGRFRDALLHRIQVCSIEVAPLRRHREDVPTLLVHFLGEQLQLLGSEGRLAPPPVGGEPWLTLQLVQELYAYDWPGNVRQLRNIAMEIAIRSYASEVASIPNSLHRTQAGRRRDASGSHTPRRRAGETSDAMYRDSGAEIRHGVTEPQPNAQDQVRAAVPTPAPRPVGARSPRPRPPSAEVSDATIIATLRDHAWNVTASAQALCVAKNTLVARMAGIDGLRRAGELAPADIDDARAEVGDNPRAMAMLLQVSERGLRLRLRLRAMQQHGDGQSRPE